MSNLYIAVTGADDETKRRALEALDAAGIEVYRAWVERTPGDDLEIAPGEATVRGTRYPNARQQ